MAKEEIIFKLSMLEQQANEIKQQIEAVNSQINELENLKSSLGKLKQGEILAPLGRGIFIKTKLEDDKVLVNVGSNVMVRKTPGETAEIISQQVDEMEKIKIRLLENIEEINHQLTDLVQEAQKQD